MRKGNQNIRCTEVLKFPCLANGSVAQALLVESA